MQKKRNRQGQTFVQWLLEVWSICDWRVRKPSEIRHARRFWRSNVTAEKFADPHGERRLRMVASKFIKAEFGARQCGKTHALFAIANEVTGTQALRDLCAQTGLPEALLDGLPERAGPSESRAHEAAFVLMGPPSRHNFSMSYDVAKKPQVVLIPGAKEPDNDRVGELTATDLTAAMQRLGGRRIHPDERFKRMYLDTAPPSLKDFLKTEDYKPDWRPYGVGIVEQALPTARRFLAAIDANTYAAGFKPAPDKDNDQP